MECGVELGRNSATDSSTNIANLDRVENTLNTSLCSNPGRGHSLRQLSGLRQSDA
jgi:hypothetical protein